MEQITEIRERPIRSVFSHTLHYRIMTHVMLHFLHDDRRPLRRERLFRDRMNPLEKYDDVEIKALFRFERHDILRISYDQ